MADGTFSTDQRFGRARQLAKTGDHAGALSDYLWCLDHGAESQPSFAPVRLSFLLGDIAALGAVYPPAAAALEQRRLALRGAVRSGSATPEQATEYAAINRECNATDETLVAYDQLRKLGMTEAYSALLPYIEEVLIMQRRYSEVLEIASDPAALVAQLLKTAELHAAMFTPTNLTPPWYSETSKRLRDAAVADGSVLYEALLGAGRDEEATRIGQALVGASPTGRTVAVLAERALHADAVHAARELAEHAVRVLSEVEVGSIRNLLERIRET